MFQIRALEETDRPLVVEKLAAARGSAMIVSRGQVYDLTMLPGLLAVQDAAPVGLLMYHVDGPSCAIITLNSWQEGQGIGTKLVNAMQQLAQQQHCQRVCLIITNDNLAAQRFYLQRGFVVKAVYPNAVEISRLLMPEIPTVSADGIPITDEIELEMTL